MLLVRVLASRLSLLLAFASAFLIAPAAQAAVTISFYSKELGASFPHAYVVLDGVLDRSGEKISANYGFTATHVSPAILMGSVKGEIYAVKPGYIANSDRHFSFVISDEEYDRLLATVERWRTLPQPSYNLERRNCVFFVADIAATLGMKAETPARLMKKPHSFIQSLRVANQTWLQGRGAVILKP